MSPSESPADDFQIGAEDGTRTRDPDLGKVVLYQLSHFRVRLNRAETKYTARIAAAWAILAGIAPTRSEERSSSSQFAHHGVAPIAANV